MCTSDVSIGASAEAGCVGRAPRPRPPPWTSVLLGVVRYLGACCSVPRSSVALGNRYSRDNGGAAGSAGQLSVFLDHALLTADTQTEGEGQSGRLRPPHCGTRGMDGGGVGQVATDTPHFGTRGRWKGGGLSGCGTGTPRHRNRRAGHPTQKQTYWRVPTGSDNRHTQTAKARITFTAPTLIPHYISGRRSQWAGSERQRTSLIKPVNDIEPTPLPDNPAHHTLSKVNGVESPTKAGASDRSPHVATGRVRL